ncbi:acyltransferase family protein [Deinococcus sp. HMF7620]|uniref:Acyltransferase family protein n=1 Tax=Deinococcus arboris TaxID=2682977 RepID=A0A7C9M984_9DEIO|nr:MULTISPECIES: acyltransferase [Deinococcus]MBZ9752145.1 acyltransferase [Deinococcus betulae]MVN87503.1 acyltransferase family protein [Deinococcus arboris]
MSTPHPRVLAFDGLRGLLALAVVLSHVAALTFLPGRTQPSSFDYLLWHFGAPAVDVFFVLSGLVVARSYVRRPALWPYLAARLRRLAPLGLLGAVLGLGLARPLAASLPADLAPHGLLPILTEPLTGLDLQGVLTLGLGGWFEANRVNPPLWTLAIELYASALLPLMVWAARRWGWTALLISLPLAFGMVFVFWPLMVMPLFLLGVLLALQPPQVPARLLPLVGVLGAGVLLCRHVLGSDDAYLRWLTALGAAGVLLALEGLQPAFFQQRWAQWLGERSYALYATHFPVMVAAVWLGWNSIGVTGSGLLAVPVCLLVAHLAHHLTQGRSAQRVPRLLPEVSHD